MTSPENLEDFAGRHGLDGFLITKNLDEKLPTTRAYPDGTTRVFNRPWYVVYFPRARWALVYWDDQALLFVDRARVPPGSHFPPHEYRWTFPGDDAARADASARGEIPFDAMRAEKIRHLAEITAP